MLVDAFPGTITNYDLRETLEQRVGYLIGRAATVATRQPDSEEPGWQRHMILATLWMDAAEGAAALARIDDARRCLSQATELLLRLRLPLGVALQRAFNLTGDQLTEMANTVMGVWGDALSTREAARERGNGRQQPEIRGAFDAAQQWAYYALAKAGAGADRTAIEGALSEDWDRARGLFSAPVGRSRLPLKDFFLVSQVTQQAVSSGGIVESRDRERVQEIVGKSLFHLYKILQHASENTYLWRRLLNPAPIFDLDAALLVARMKEAPGLASLDLISKTGERDIDKQSGRYAIEFVRTVESLRGGPGPGRNNESTPEPAPLSPSSEVRAGQASFSL